MGSSVRPCAAHKIDFTVEHAAARLTFSQTNVNRNWQTVIFCDEKVFSTDIGSRKPLYRLPNTRYEEQNIVRTRRSGRICLGLWGWKYEIRRTKYRKNKTQWSDLLGSMGMDVSSRPG
ncbi:hypothetical protein QE152_g34875 [Popillia japonica]|uniref:Uncharacterized protein n=1 Tax=Popillia japonica TaxID=7064 RepID=A0AAW1IT58_POPJA